jgi:hypothetical protein
MISPIEFIAALRETYPERYSTSNGCLKFHRLLKAVFPEASGYYDSDHIITEIDGEFFDIDGQVEEIGGYLPIEEFGVEFIERTFTDTLHLEQTS